MTLEDLIVSILSTSIRLAIPITIAALGELFVERSGIMNLGVEGIMILGALSSLIATSFTQNLWIGVLAGILVGGLLAFFFAFMTVTVKVDQAILGISMVVFSWGLSGLVVYKIFQSFQVSPGMGFRKIPIPMLSEIPVIGEPLFNQNILIYITFLLVPICALILSRTTFGLKLRTVGENPKAADSAGINVSFIRYVATIFGGMMAGLAGAYMILAYSSTFSENLIFGRGWMAIVLVVFGSWNAYKIFFGSLLFGAIYAIQLRLQIEGGVIGLYEFMLMLPYVATIIVLTVARIRASRAKKEMPEPAALGKPYIREETG